MSPHPSRTNPGHAPHAPRKVLAIVTVEVDKHHSHETVMGTDGQNPNLKEVFYLYVSLNESPLSACSVVISPTGTKQTLHHKLRSRSGTGHRAKRRAKSATSSLLPRIPLVNSSRGRRGSPVRVSWMAYVYLYSLLIQIRTRDQACMPVSQVPDLSREPREATERGDAGCSCETAVNFPVTEGQGPGRGRGAGPGSGRPRGGGERDERSGAGGRWSGIRRLGR